MKQIDVVDTPQRRRMKKNLDLAEQKELCEKSRNK